MTMKLCKKKLQNGSGSVILDNMPMKDMGGMRDIQHTAAMTGNDDMLGWSQTGAATMSCEWM